MTPAKDLFHDCVCFALKKEGWVVTSDPYTIPLLGTKVYIDLGADKAIAAEKGVEKIAIEIKSFLSLSLVTDLYHALGQFQLYRLALKKKEPDRVLLLALPKTTYDSLMQYSFMLDLIAEYDLKMLIFNAQNQVVEKWIK